ncbi:MAG: hypothetical protein AAB176_14210 [Pseudomonadota bacterium]|jgi:hypothetical protein
MNENRIESDAKQDERARNRKALVTRRNGRGSEESIPPNWDKESLGIGPGHYEPDDLNHCNRPMRTRVPGGVAGAAAIMEAPYVDCMRSQ